MGLPAAKHLDPVLGVDTHIVLIPSPAGPIPTPIPHPYVGMLLDPMDYVPMMGTSIRVNGLPRAVAGTSGMACPPHIPMGGPFAKPPSNESEMYMGSLSVNADGDPMSFASLPVLSCQDIGMPAPARAKKKTVAKSLMLPTSVVIPIPSGSLVLVGGAPTIAMPGITDALAPLGKGMIRARKALARGNKKFARRMKNLSRKLHKFADEALDKLKIPKKSLVRNRVHRGICTVTGHPVDVATGKLFTDFTDLTLNGPLPFALERVWYSTSTYEGPYGHGWHHSLDMALTADAHVVAVRLADGRAALCPPLQVGERYFDTAERHTVERHNDGYTLSTIAGLSYRFAEVRGRAVHPLSSIQDRNGFALTLTSDAAGRLLQLTDASGRIWSFVYDTHNRVARMEGPHPTEADKRAVFLSYAYDGRGNLAEVRDALGHAQRCMYERALLVQESNRNGLSFYFAWDGQDAEARCLRTWGDGGIYDHKLSYQGRTTVVENSLGHKTAYHHDGAMVHKVVDPLGRTTHTEYDAGYRVVAQIDALGQRTSHSYDARGNLSQTMAPDGAAQRILYDADDLPVSVVDALGGAWTLTRDTRGRVVERQDPLGRVTRYHYHAQWLVGITAPDGGYTGVGYDARGNIDAVATPDNATTRYGYDLLGRTTDIVDPRGNTQRRELDALGRATKVHEADGNVRTLAYDAEGNVVQADDKHHSVRFTYRGMNRLASRSEAGTRVQFEYDTEEQLVAIANEHGRVYRFVLGATGEVDEEHGFDGLMRKYARNAGGRVTRIERPAERFSDYRYDPAGRVTRVTHSDESFESYAYRPDGALIHASNAERALDFQRDALGRILKESQAEHWVSSSFDALGLRTEMRSSLGASLHIQRGVMGDVASVEEQSGFRAAFARDQMGLEVERTLPGGVRSRWQRDALGRPLQHTTEVASIALRAVSYQWDVNDRLRGVVDAQRGPTQYQHDPLGNLVSARYPDGQGEIRVADAVGNLFKREDQKDRLYGPAGELLAQSTQHGQITYRYDPEGNLVEKQEPDGRTWRYHWNLAGMLQSVLRPDGDEVTFGYDALGRRVRKTYRGQSTKWVWDGNVPLHEWVEGALEPRDDEAAKTAGHAARPDETQRDADLRALLAQTPAERGLKAAPITWLFEPESFSPLAKLVGERQYSIVTDHLGTPVLMLDDAGQRVWSAGTSVFGALRDNEGARHACPFRWPGQYEDAETGLYYNRFRYYDPESGRYASQDPLRSAAGIRFYGYVSSPLKYADPLGLIEQVLTEGVVYRGGSDSDSNFTPRPGKDTEGHKRGLSTFTTIERAAKPGERAQIIDVAKLGPDVEAVLNDEHGHVSIRPKADPGGAKLDMWAAERGKPNPLTDQVRQANAAQVKRPDCR